MPEHLPFLFLLMNNPFLNLIPSWASKISRTNRGKEDCQDRTRITLSVGMSASSIKNVSVPRSHQQPCWRIILRGLKIPIILNSDNSNTVSQISHQNDHERPYTEQLHRDHQNKSLQPLPQGSCTIIWLRIEKSMYSSFAPTMNEIRQ